MVILGNPQEMDMEKKTMEKNKKIRTWLKSGLTVLMAVSIVAGCGRSITGGDADNNEAGKEGATPANDNLPLNILDDNYRTTYEIFVYSFYDSDGDGIGDLNGVSKMLDYINDGDDTTDTDLGCNEIWLMPISPSPTYHKYDVTDYKDIDPQYGTLQDFDNLVKKCHERGINVIIDTVFNHSSSEHPWFLEAAGYLKEHPGLTFSDEDSGDMQDAPSAESKAAFEQALSECPYLEYYTFSNVRQPGFEPLPDTEYYYEARFWSGMPDINLDSEAVRKELSGITHFWTDRGVDGFRLDATTYYYTGEDEKNIEFLKWLKQDNPDSYFVGEAWVSSATYQKYYESGIDSFFDFEYAGSEGVIASIVRGTSPAARFAQSLEKTERSLSGTYVAAIDAPFYTNHDMARSAGYYTGSGGQDRIKLAYGLSLIMGGNSFIYYGEELGMKGSGKDENKRAPMYWTAGENAAETEQPLDPSELPVWAADLSSGMCNGPKDMDRFKMKYPALDEQMQDPYSIYNYFKSAIRLRNTYPVVARGRTTALDDLSNENICAFTRSVTNQEAQAFISNAKGGSFGPTELLFIINTSDEEQSVDLSASDTAGDFGKVAYRLNTSEIMSTVSGTVITVPPYGIVVLR